MKKKLVNILLIIVMVFTINIYDTDTAKAASVYSPKAALTYAAAHWDDGIGLCAEYVSKCLTAGGLSNSYTTVTGVRDFLVNNEHCTLYKLETCKSNSGNLMVKKSSNTGKVKEGDVIFWYCPACGKWSHVEMCGGFDSEGYMTIYAHNRAYNNMKMYVNQHCKGTDMYVYSGYMKTVESITVEYYDEDNGTLVGTSFFDYGVATSRLTDTELGISKKGYTFAGWKAYRTCDNKWYGYRNGSTTAGWYTELNISSAKSFEYYLYPAEGKCSKTASSGTVKLYAQWTPNVITVNYYNEMGGSQVGTSTYTYGGSDKRLSSSNLKLKKDNYWCTGFSVYRSCDKKWKGYLNDSTTAGWYTASQIASANYFEYYIYPDKSQKISTLASSGTVNFYAMWESTVTGHEYRKILTNLADTENDGLYTYRCIYCYDEYTESISKIKTVKLEYSSVTYNGKSKTPKVTVKDDSGEVINEEYYSVKYKSNQNPGVATVTITFKDKYTGTVTKTFKIKPKTAKIKTVTNVSGYKIKVKWTKASEKITGYKVQYAADKKFTSGKTTYTVKSLLNYVTTKKLTKNKTYYVRVRAYKETSDGTIVYGAWSNTLKVKIKK